MFGVGGVSAPKDAEPAAAVTTQSSLASLPSAKEAPGSTTKPLSKVASDASKPSKAATLKSSTIKSGAGSISTGPLKLLSTTVEQQKFSAEAGKEVLRARETEAFLKEKLSGHNGMTFWVCDECVIACV